MDETVFKYNLVTFLDNCKTVEIKKWAPDTSTTIADTTLGFKNYSILVSEPSLVGSACWFISNISFFKIYFLGLQTIMERFYTALSIVKFKHKVPCFVSHSYQC